MNYLICVKGAFDEIGGYVSSKEMAEELTDVLNKISSDDETYYFEEDTKSLVNHLPNIEYMLGLAKKKLTT